VIVVRFVGLVPTIQRNSVVHLKSARRGHSGIDFFNKFAQPSKSSTSRTAKRPRVTPSGFDGSCATSM
jgi:hypothetical protein